VEHTRAGRGGVLLVLNSQPFPNLHSCPVLTATRSTPPWTLGGSVAHPRWSALAFDFDFGPVRPARVVRAVPPGASGCGTLRVRAWGSRARTAGAGWAAGPTKKPPPPRRAAWPLRTSTPRGGLGMGVTLSFLRPLGRLLGRGSATCSGVAGLSRLRCLRARRAGMAGGGWRRVRERCGTAWADQAGILDRSVE
jgi:hypothetical protein